MVSCIDGTFRLLKTIAYGVNGNVNYESKKSEIVDIKDSNAKAEIRDAACKKLNF